MPSRFFPLKNTNFSVSWGKNAFDWPNQFPDHFWLVQVAWERSFRAFPILRRKKDITLLWAHPKSAKTSGYVETFIRYHFHCILERDDDICKTQLKAIVSMIFYKYLTNTTPISVEIFIAAESILVEKAIYIHILQFRVILIKSKDVRFSYSVYLTKHNTNHWIGYIWEASSWLAFKHWIYLNLCRWTVSDIFLFLDSSEFPVTTFWK